jgi:hypothetical protein
MKIEAPKAWGAAEEISGAKIPGMPESKRGVAKRAIKEGWKHRPHIGRRGGGIEFCVADFARTDAQREAWEVHCSQTESSLSAAAKTKPECAGDPPARAMAGATFANSCLAAEADIIPSKATPEEIAEAKRRYMAASEETKENTRSISWRGFEIADAIILKNRQAGRPAGKMAAFKTAGHAVGRSKDKIRRDYYRAVRFPNEYRLMVLIPGWEAHERQSEIERDAEIRDAILQTATYAPNAPHTETPQIARALQRQFPEGRWLPTVQQIRYFLSRWKEENQSLFVGLTNPRRFNNEHLTAIGDSTAKLTRPNENVQFDFSPADIDCLDGLFKIGQAIDPFTGLGELRLCEHPSAEEFAMLYCDWTVRDPFLHDGSRPLKI